MLADQCFEHDKRCLELSAFLDHANEYDAAQFMEKRMLELRYAYTYVLGESRSPMGVDKDTLVKFMVETCATKKLVNHESEITEAFDTATKDPDIAQRTTSVDERGEQ